MTGGFHVASSEDIRGGRVTDVYFVRGREILRALGRDPHVVAEVRAASLPHEWPWALLAGMEEVLILLEGRGVDARALPEGSVFYPEEPVLELAGPYLAFGELETALLGFLSQASGIATAAARCKFASGGRPVYSFGARRMHPAITPMVERSAYIGGCDGVATIPGAELVGTSPVGTMAHGLVLMLGEEEAWRGFDRVIDPRVPRVALIDTFQDEKFGAAAAARVLGERLAGVRLDTPASRRGNFAAILREVRWELDRQGFSQVRLFCSGGIDEQRILELNRYADAYGVGGSISNASVVDFAMDIVEVDGETRAKRGKMSGRKHFWACSECGNRGLAPAVTKLGDCPRCGHRVSSLLETTLARGTAKRATKPAREIRQFALDQVARAPRAFPAEE
ncbi:MAG: nicotinate phosphoribosyltransferase [Actinobacteria bacterium]|nr:nicotinate phosphoribosyltransferase [Actinomycetota bacterium]